MIRHRLLHDDRGLSLSELLVVSLVTAIVSVILLGMLGSLFNNVGFQFALGDTQAEVRPELRGLIINLREARPVGNTSADDPVGELAWDHLVIYTNTTPGAVTDAELDVERVEYELVPTIVNAGTQLYQLERRIYPALNAGNRPLNFAAIPAETVVMLDNVIASAAEPLFRGAYFDSAGTKQIVTSCTGINCDITLIELYLQVDPSLTTDNPRIYEIDEEVRLRNG